jgi:hypothetical protein
MFVTFPQQASEARPSRPQAQYVELVSAGVGHAPFSYMKPTLPLYVYGPVRLVVPVRTPSGPVLPLLLHGVVSMATVAPQKAVLDKKLDVQSAVQRNFSEWMDAVAVSSDADVMLSHPAYKRIVSLGDGAVPVILQSLRKGPSLLAWALFDITKANPVPPADYGKLDKITEAWLKWGKQNKYI